MLLAPRPLHLPGLPVGRPGGARGAPDLRREPSRRHARSPAIRAACCRRQVARGGEAGLHDERRHGGGVLPLQGRRPTAAPATRHARRGRATSTSRRWTCGEDARRAIVDALEQMGFEVEAAHHEVAHGQHEIDFRYADALTHGRQHRHVPVRGEAGGAAVRAHRVVHAQADLRAERQRHAHAPVAVPAGAERLLGPAARVGAVHAGAALHRRAAASTRAAHVRDHQPAGELVQAAGAGLRGAGERGLVDAQPLAA